MKTRKVGLGIFTSVLGSFVRKSPEISTEFDRGSAPPKRKQVEPKRVWLVFVFCVLFGDGESNGSVVNDVPGDMGSPQNLFCGVIKSRP